MAKAPRYLGRPKADPSVGLYFERAGSGDGSSGATADLAPTVDIEEYADKFVIWADVPGV